MRNFYPQFFLFKIVIALFISTGALYSAERGWNSPELAEAYHHHSEMQKNWAMELIDSFSFDGIENVLDFGCGDGKITAHISQLVPNGSVKGFDISQEMIRLAEALFPTSSYKNLLFQSSDISGEYDLICSFSVFHFVDNPLDILINLKSHLKPTGHLLLTIPEAPNSAKRLIANEILQKYEIEQPWKNRDSYTQERSIRTAENCTLTLQEAGYEILSIQRVDTPFLFENIKAYIDWLRGTSSANWGIPFSISHVFYTEYVSKLIELDPQFVDDHGRVSVGISRIHVVAKPFSIETSKL